MLFNTQWRSAVNDCKVGRQLSIVRQAPNGPANEWASHLGNPVFNDHRIGLVWVENNYSWLSIGSVFCITSEQLWVVESENPSICLWFLLNGNYDYGVFWIFRHRQNGAVNIAAWMVMTKCASVAFKLFTSMQLIVWLAIELMISKGSNVPLAAAWDCCTASYSPSRTFWKCCRVWRIINRGLIIPPTALQTINH